MGSVTMTINIPILAINPTSHTSYATTPLSFNVRVGSIESSVEDSNLHSPDVSSPVRFKQFLCV